MKPIFVPQAPTASFIDNFSNTLLAWHKEHGRHDLPWQNTHDPYAIWVSEIMLQQTQVSAVIDYYQRFMARFSTIASLAKAHQDEVMQYWSGLGYYTRARNLHQAAQTIVNHHDGVFPQKIEQIVALKGIGRSTAAAIMVFAFNQRYPILDGNVKRVFSRIYAIEGWPGLPQIEQQLWHWVEQHISTPVLKTQNLVSYTQSLMDFGARQCTRNKPHCLQCPLKQSCMAYQQGRVAQLPTAKPRIALPKKTTTMLVIVHNNNVLLQKRANQGIWGGLWSLPEIDGHEDAVKKARQQLGVCCHSPRSLDTIHHVFTHFKLDISPLLLIASEPAFTEHQVLALVWMPIEEALMVGIPTPVKKILDTMR